MFMPNDASPQDIEPVSRTWTSQGLTLNYVDWGNESAPLLILLHGNSDHARSWDWTARALCKDWRVVAPDLRGHGDSAWSPDGAYLSPYHVMDFVDLMDQAFAGQKATIVAHSFGGVVAMRYAAMFPERVAKLAIVDGQGPSRAILDRWAAIGYVKRTRDWIEKRRKFTSRAPRVLASVEDAAERMRAENKSLSEAQALHLARHGVRQVEGGYVWKRDPQVAAFAVEDFLADGPDIWTQIKAPTLFLYATKSWKYDPDAPELEKHFVDSRALTFDGAGHWIHHDRLDAFVAALRGFL